MIEFVGVETDEDMRRAALEGASGACSICVRFQNGSKVEISGALSGAAVGEIVRAAGL